MRSKTTGICKQRNTVSAVLLGIVVPILVLSTARSAAAGVGIINANQHKTQEATTCNPTPAQCVQGITLPLNDLGTYGFLDANAFHVKDETGCQAAQARCFYYDRSKSKILSSDPPPDEFLVQPALDPEFVKDWILDITAETLHPRGSIHFEHFDYCLSYKAQRGESISTFGTFPNIADCHAYNTDLFPDPGYTVSPQAMLVWIRDQSGASLDATRLRQNGWLHRDGDTEILKWKASTGTTFEDYAKRLVGMGFMGALTADSHLTIDEYFKTLRAHNVNFTRVWAVEQWVGTSPGLQGLTPFDGHLTASGYNLDQDNPHFFDRLRQFAQNAADRGIVVQLSLFDKHGLICPGKPFRYRDSPYRDANNEQPFLSNTIPNCDCSTPSGECYPLYSFVGDTGGEALQVIHKRFLRRVGEEAGGIGNVIFEIINEARAPDPDYSGDWPNAAPSPSTTTWNQQWQKDMTRELRLGLPLGGLVRDAFNGDDDGTILATKGSDVEATGWIPPTYGAKVKAPTTETGGLVPARKLGYVTSMGDPHKFMVGTLPITAPQNWTKLHLRADLECVAGRLHLGTKTSTTPGNPGDQVWVDFECPEDGTEWPWSLIRLFKRKNGVTNYLASIVLEDYSGSHNIRLVIGNNAGTYSAKVYVDGALETNTISLGTGWSFPYVYFWGEIAPDETYPADAGKVDNFEAAYFCDDEARACQP